MVKLVNAVTDAYMEEVVNADNNRRKERLAKLKEILSGLTEKISDRRATLTKLAERAGGTTGDVVAEAWILQQELRDVAREALRVES